MSDRLGRLLKSIAGLPLWVQGWLVVLIAVNTASLWFLDSPVGRWTAAAFAFVGALNLPIAMWQAGLTRLLSFPHVIWVPLLIYLGLWLSSPSAAGAGSAVHGYAVAVLVANSISLMFDVMEARRWINGEREVLGLGSDRVAETLSGP